MIRLSIRLVRTALFAFAASLVTSYAASSLAQVPIYQPEPQPESRPEPEPEPGVAPAPAAPAPSPSATAVVPNPAPATPPAVTAPTAQPPGWLSSRTPPAKADVITERRPLDEDDTEVESADEALGPRRKWY